MMRLGLQMTQSMVLQVQLFLIIEIHLEQAREDFHVGNFTLIEDVRPLL